jgi:hypothetical protein
MEVVEENILEEEEAVLNGLFPESPLPAPVIILI